MSKFVSLTSAKQTLLIGKKLAADTSLFFIKKLLKQNNRLNLYLVGGAVRDILLNIAGSKDYDLVATGLPLNKLTRELTKLGRVNLVGRHFGVIKFLPKNSRHTNPIDIALPRTEVARQTGGRRDFKIKSDYRLSIDEDLARRDLTINAIAYDLREDKIIDPFLGRADLARGLIRTVGNPSERFQEDYSRLLRAIRFATRFNFDFETKTYVSLKRLSPHILDVRPTKSGTHEFITPLETTTSEVLKILSAAPLRGYQILRDTGFLKKLLPQTVKLDKTLEAGLKKLSTSKFHREFPNYQPAPDVILGFLLVATALTINTPLNTLTKNFSLTTKTTSLYSWLHQSIRELATNKKLSLQEQESLFDSPDTETLLIMIYLLSLKNLRFYNRIKRLKTHFDKLRTHNGQLPGELLSGDEIIALGEDFQSGKIIGHLKNQLREQQLQGKLKTKSAAKRWIADRHNILIKNNLLKSIVKNNMSQKGFIIIIGGPTGIGKSTITKLLLKKFKNSTRIITTTTRAKRPGEKNNVDYHFITTKEFQTALAKGQFLESTKFVNNYYGTKKSDFEKPLQAGQIVFFNCDFLGVQAMKKFYPHDHLSIFLNYESPRVIKGHFLSREPNIDKKLLADRVAKAKKELKEAKFYDKIIINREGQVKETVDAVIREIKKAIS